jgi:hypothetical protein
MTPEDFVVAVVDAYSNSREPIRPHVKLHRGESRSIASETEDLLAFYLVSQIPSIERIFINQPLTPKAGRGIKPDLVICQRSQISDFLDVKMDLGYKRDKFESTLDEKNVRLSELHGQVFSISADNRRGRERITLPLAQNARYHFVIISDRNVSPDIFRRFEERASRLSNIAFHVLTRRCHPNEHHWPKDTIMARIEICHQAFKGMVQEIQLALAEPTG